MRTAGGSHNLSVSCVDSIHALLSLRDNFSLIGGIGPWEGSLGAYKTIKIQCKKVQTGKSGPHLLLTANIPRQLLTNLVYRIRRRAAKTRRVTIEWNDA